MSASFPSADISLEDFKDASDAAADTGDLQLALEILDRARDIRLAQFWCKAEQRDFDSLADVEREQIFERVRQRADAGPGDLAVAAVLLLHQLRAIDEHPREILKAAVGENTRVQRLHCYDSFEVDDQYQPCITLFNNTNIGTQFRSNLQVGGQLSFERIVLTSWYVTTLPSLPHLDGTLGLELLSRIRMTATLNQLLKRPQRLLMEIPKRCTLYVKYEAAYAPPPPRGTRVYIHFEGWEVNPSF